MSGLPLPFYDNRLLFGHAARPGLIAFETGEHTVRIWSRAAGETRVSEEPFRPFLLLADPDLLKDFKGDAGVTPLDGAGTYRWLAELGSWSQGLKARDHIQKVSGRAPGAPDAPYRFLSDPTQQFLLRSGCTSFLGMGFEGLRRMAVDIEVTTAPGFEFPNAARESDRIIAIALADSTGFTTVLSGALVDEADLLRECTRIIRERDPDVIEGHNIFRFDLEYIEARARRHKVALTWGRDGATLGSYPSRMQIAERTIGYRRYRIRGRHIVDTWILAQLYDVGARDLESYGLKDVARHFGIAAPDRTYLPPEDIPRIFREEPERLMAYARDDVLETLGLSAILSPPYFVQAQALPLGYEAVVLRGNATKIDALLMREYLHRGRAVPSPSAGRAVAGGHTAMLLSGVAKGVLHVDVTSLYPSLMLTQEIAPGGDGLGVFPTLLRDLREFRVAAKRLAREAAAPAERTLAGALQQTFKILINSFYGYLAFSQGHWNDYDAANRVTGEGRALVQRLVARLGELGAAVIEVDTDGIYFVPPSSSLSPTGGEGRVSSRDAADEPEVRRAARRGLSEAEGESHLVAELERVLPPGIQLELDGRYEAMFSYKMKNYVLLDARGKLLVKGSGLRSRGIELFQRRWMEEMFRLLLTGHADEIPALNQRWQTDFQAHRVPVRHFMKTETLQESPAGYQDKVREGKRNPSAAYELALRSQRPYQPGDQVSYYVTGADKRVKVNESAKLAVAWDQAAPDENTEYYLDKLDDLYEKFRPLIEQDGLRPAGETETPPESPQAELEF
ncbi:MAG TPA: DNA polymerase domain-containing protein [Methylomirabilota bacterium]|nr:DNA polymerase domain-containing protein [Methylomirabilota bacterium]